MNLSETQVYAEKVLAVLQPFCSCIMTAGSIRRGKAEVGDVDIVALPKAVDLPGGLCGVVKVDDPSTVWKNLIPKALVKSGLKLEVSGKELHRFSFPSGLQVDVYRARSETWGVILLIRTGSKEHNVKLCTLARVKGLMLSASQGVIENHNIVACRTEEGIFSALGLKFVEPKDREVHF